MPARSYSADDPARTMSPYASRLDTFPYAPPAGADSYRDPYRESPRDPYREQQSPGYGYAPEPSYSDVREPSYRENRGSGYSAQPYGRALDERGPYADFQREYPSGREDRRSDARRPSGYREDYRRDYRDEPTRGHREVAARGYRDQPNRGYWDDEPPGRGRFDRDRDDRDQERRRGPRFGRSGGRPTVNRAPATRTPILVRGTLVAGVIVAIAAALVRAGLGTADATHGQTTLVLGQNGVSAVQTIEPSPAAKQPAAMAAAAPGAACGVEYATTSRSAGQFTAVVAVANTGAAAVNGWTLAWTFTPATRLTNGWNATFTSTGTQERATSTAADRVIPRGGSATIGFVGVVAPGATAPVPSGFSLNGVTCR